MRSSARLVEIFATAVALTWLAPRPARADDSAFVYVDTNPDRTANAIAGILTTADGHVSAVTGSPFATGGLGLAVEPGAEFAHRIEVAASRNLLFAANDGSGTVSVFNIEPISGALAAVLGSPFSVSGGTPSSGISLAVSHDGRFLYASGASLVSFFVDANGGLNEIGSRWSFSQRVAGIAITADNSRLFLSTPTGVTILHTGEGGLTADPPAFLSLGSTATDLRANASGSRIWVGTKSGGITAYSYDTVNAALVPGAPFFVSVSGLSGLAIDSDAQSLFAYSPTGPLLAGMHVNSDGSLVLRGSPLIPPLAAISGAVTPDGHRLLLADSSGQLDAWATVDGSVTHLSGFPVLTGAAAGSPSVVTFPKTTPVPAAPGIMLAMLVALMLLAGFARLRPQTTR
ncbi:MAG TPA: hypothetical protein VNW92_23350 [Polyangiaceae bacterium]|nr:hypothetical protein [Polyangiaceae bacterium]